MITTLIYATTFINSSFPNITWDDRGDNELFIDDNTKLEPLFFQPAQYKIEAYQNGSCIWSGYVAEIQRKNTTYNMRAKGDIYQFDQIEDYTEFWSDYGPDNWLLYDVTNSYSVAPVTPVQGSFDTKGDDTTLYATLRKGSAIPSNSGMALYWHPPFGSANRVSQCIFTLENRLPTGWSAILQARDENGTFLENVTVAGNDTLRRNLIYKTYTNNPFYLYLILINQTGGTYTVTAETDTYFVRAHDIRILARNQDQSTTTITSSVAPGSAVTVTPASMTGIYEGSKVAFVASGEMVTASQVTTTTFKADLRNGHPNGDTLLIPRLQVSTVVSGIVTPYYSGNKVIEQTNNDISRAFYIRENALNVLEDLAGTGNSIQPFDMFSTRGIFYFRSQSNRPTYYADADRYDVSLDLFNTPDRIRAEYEIGKVKAVSPYSQRTDRSTQLRRTKTIKPGITASGLLPAYTTSAVNQPLLSKTQVEIPDIQNVYHGDLPLADVYIPANVVITNIDPMLAAVKTVFALREIRVNDENEAEYILDELPDTIETFLAK